MNTEKLIDQPGNPDLQGYPGEAMYFDNNDPGDEQPEPVTVTTF